jgi:SpoU rRNA methylase family enzyme
VHSAVAKMCLRSKSHGKGENRVLHITRIVAKGQVSPLFVDPAAAAAAVGGLAEVSEHTRRACCALQGLTDAC